MSWRKYAAILSATAWFVIAIECILHYFFSFCARLFIPLCLVGTVGVAGLPQGVDEKAAEAGIAAWNKYRAGMKK